MNDYYVYVYIDPRNFEEFYFGKGKRSRKDAHLADTANSKKTRRIAAIRNAGLEPIIRVIARQLSHHDALLVEKTLLWRLGRHLTNVSTGHYADKFRPHDTLHRELSGFDYQGGLYYYNVGEGPGRNWDDCRTFGFIAAGNRNPWRAAILGLKPGDVVAAYLKKHGFVGIGILRDQAKPIREVTIKDKPLLSHNLRCRRMQGEYVAPVKWVVAVRRSQAKWKPKAGLFTTQLVRASLDGQPQTVAFLETAFGIKMAELLK